MTTTSTPASDVAQENARTEAQEAFVSLLIHPLVSARAKPVLFRNALRHRARLSEWSARLGYRLVVAGSVVRLHRDPSGPQLTAAPPPMEPPPRRDLVLLALVAAACEDSVGSTTVQDLSDEVRALSASPAASITPYDPDRRAERQAFVRALGRLTELGILTRRTTDEVLLKQWEDEGTGVGGGFDIDTDSLLQFTDPHTVGLALNHVDSTDADGDTGRSATRGQRMLRTLVESTVLLYADLHPADAEYARTQRSWLAGQATDMTGGAVEMRAEGLLLRLRDDSPAAAEATPAFPAATAGSWFALKMLDAAIKTGPAPDDVGRVNLSSAAVDAIAAHLHAEHHRALTRALADSPGRIRVVAEDLLAGLGLLRVGGDAGWTLLPTAARYRDPKAVWEPALTDAQSGGAANDMAHDAEGLP